MNILLIAGSNLTPNTQNLIRIVTTLDQDLTDPENYRGGETEIRLKASETLKFWGSDALGVTLRKRIR